MSLVERVHAAPVVFSTNTVAVTLDGIPLGTQTTGSGLRNTVVQGADGLHHLWAIKNGADSYVSRMVHATSSDGVHFTTQGLLQPPADYWKIACGALAIPAAEPIATFVRVSQVGGEWRMAVWHQNQTGGHNWYSYNTSVWRIGVDPNNLSVQPLGPLPTTTCGTASAPGRFHIGVFGMDDGPFIYLRHVPQASALAGSVGGNLGRYGINTTASPPSTTPRPASDASNPKLTLEANLFTGTGYAETTPLPAGTARALVYNAGRSLNVNGALGTYYNFADFNTTAALEKDLWYVESTDGGGSWTAPVRIYGTQGPNVLVNGLPNGGNFSAPEVTSGGRSYFVTRDACNNSVMVTPARAADDPRMSISMQFNPASILVGQTTQLSVTLQAPAGCTPAPALPVVSNLAYAHALPANLKFTGAVISNNCTGTLTAPADGALGLTSGSLAAGQTCTAVLEVSATAAGNYSDRIATTDVTNAQNLTPAQDATADLLVSALPVVHVATPVPATGWTALALLASILAFCGVGLSRSRR